MAWPYWRPVSGVHHRGIIHERHGDSGNGRRLGSDGKRDAVRLGRLALREAIREGNGQLTHGSLAAIAALVAREAAPDAPAPEHTP